MKFKYETKPFTVKVNLYLKDLQKCVFNFAIFNHQLRQYTKLIGFYTLSSSIINRESLFTAIKT